MKCCLLSKTGWHAMTASYRSALDVSASLRDTFALFYLYFTRRDKWNMMRKHWLVRWGCLLRLLRKAVSLPSTLGCERVNWNKPNKQIVYLHGIQCHPQITLVSGIMSVFHQLLLGRSKLNTHYIRRQASSPLSINMPIIQQPKKKESCSHEHCSPAVNIHHGHTPHVRI